MLTAALVERLRATINDISPANPDAVPLAAHWCLAPPAVPPDELGPDGHPARGGFLPPVPLPRRMWAGGALRFHRKLKIGDTVTRTSRIADVAEKVGRSGRLVFVTVEHEIETNRGLAITEHQDIVYREAQAACPKEQASAAQPDPRKAEHRHAIEATTTLLFRYSALTFNGHRIHYDRDYARDVEGYTGLVVHGPLQATFLINFAAGLDRSRPLTSFSYRGGAPLIDGAVFTINASRTERGFDLWSADSSGTTTMQAAAVSEN